MRASLIPTALAAAVAWTAPAFAQAPCPTAAAALAAALQEAAVAQDRIASTFATASRDTDMVLPVLDLDTDRRMLQAPLARLAAAQERAQATRAAIDAAIERTKSACGIP